MNDALREVAKRQRDKTPFCDRYIEFLRAHLGKAITDSVVFNIVNWQWKKGELREDRQFKWRYRRNPMSAGAFKANEEAVMANKSDGKILAQMAEFKDKNLLDMCEVGESWFVYITEGGTIPGA